MDEWFVDLSTKNKMLFIYLLTNSHINLIGIYELSDRVICFDTGLSKSDLEKGKKSLKGKVVFLKNWVKIVNVEKYDSYAGGKLLKAKDKQLSEIPQEIIKKLDTLSIPYPYPMDSTNSNSNSNSNSNKIKNNKGIDSLNDEFCSKVAVNYDVPIANVLKKKNDLILYCRSTGKKYKDYKATLQAWIRKDIK